MTRALGPKRWRQRAIRTEGRSTRDVASPSSSSSPHFSATASTAKSASLDHTLVPHIVERIGRYAPSQVRSTSRHWATRIDSSAAHWRIQDTKHPTAPPTAQLTRRAPHDGEISHARYLDVAGPPDPRWIFPALEVVRYLHSSHGNVRFEASTVILYGTTDWTMGYWSLLESPDISERLHFKDTLMFPEMVEHVVMSTGEMINAETPGTWASRDGDQDGSLQCQAPDCGAT